MISKWMGHKKWQFQLRRVFQTAVLGVLIFLVGGCGALGDQPVAPAPALPTAAGVAQVPPTPTLEATIDPPTPTLPAPRVTVPTVTPLSVPTVTPLAVPTLTALPRPTAPPTVTPAGGSDARAVIREDGKVYLGDQLLIDPAADVGGCFDPGEITYSPTEEHFVVVLACFEGDNHAFIFREDGSQKRQITGQWDYVNYYEFEWSDDGQEFIYQRIDSCCAEPPSDAPQPGRVSFNVETGQKILLEAAQLPPTALPPTAVPPTQTATESYRVVGVASDDVLNIRSGPGVSNGIVGTIPYNGIGVRIIGGGTMVSGSLWVPIQYGGVTGWVNSFYLDEE